MKRLFCLLTGTACLFCNSAIGGEVKWNVWFWNNTTESLALQRVHEKCWDPQELAYLTVGPGQLVTFTTATEEVTKACYARDAWVVVQIIQLRTGAKVSRFKLERRGYALSANATCLAALMDNTDMELPVSDSAYTWNNLGDPQTYESHWLAYACYPSQYPTLSLTVQQNIVASGYENTIDWGLNPLDADPVAIPQTVGTKGNVAVSGNLGINDKGVRIAGVWTWKLANPPANGTVVLNANGTYTYTPNWNYSGEDGFTYTITNRRNMTASGTVVVKIAPNVDIRNCMDTWSCP